MRESHPFGNFIPSNIRYLLLGSFTGQRTEKDIAEGYDWFYGTKRNLFWPIVREVYNTPLKTKTEKQGLFSKLGIGIADIILSCERKSNSNLDKNLANIVLNSELQDILKKGRLEKIYFSSRYVEKLYRRYFKNLIEEYPNIELITLPSPSPRYAAMSKVEKISRYKELFPNLLE